ncbi:MAG: 6,7-dimethyl-8-ribityllumazine synthase [Actinomycetota bacterium]|nr:6,7-dimethyl-8-ribityllumazine synthase [Actinomycetota bacterium]
MSGAGAAHLDPVDASELSLGIAVTHWHRRITDALLDRALAAAAECGVPSPTMARVAGALELAVVVQQLTVGNDAVVALGAVVRGGTPHFDYVCQSVTAALTRLALDERTPIGNAVLTCDTVEQALDRCGLPGSNEDKGWEATVAALDTALVLKALRHPGGPIGFYT